MFFEREKKLKEAFKKIKEELDDHLNAINENTNEINLTNDAIQALEEKINKLSERLEEIEFKLGQKKQEIKKILLTPKEYDVFLILYSRTGDLLTYREISKNLGLTESSVRKYIENIIFKGVPIIKKYFEDKVFLILDADFRNLQAKENIVVIN